MLCILHKKSYLKMMMKIKIHILFNNIKKILLRKKNNIKNNIVKKIKKLYAKKEVYIIKRINNSLVNIKNNIVKRRNNYIYKKDE